jgi:hypothetical protein
VPAPLEVPPVAVPVLVRGVLPLGLLLPVPVLVRGGLPLGLLLPVPVGVLQLPVPVLVPAVLPLGLQLPVPVLGAIEVWGHRAEGGVPACASFESVPS